MKFVYSYNNDGVYIGSSEAFLDPLETELQGEDIYIIPSNATMIEIPIYDKENQYLIWSSANWNVTEIDRPAPVVPTPEEERQQAYETMLYKEDGTDLLEWEGTAITIDTANKKWLDYSAEGSTAANELSALIVSAKAYIRELYPNE